MISTPSAKRRKSRTTVRVRVRARVGWPVVRVAGSGRGVHHRAYALMEACRTGFSQLGNQCFMATVTVIPHRNSVTVIRAYQDAGCSFDLPINSLAPGKTGMKGVVETSTIVMPSLTVIRRT